MNYALVFLVGPLILLGGCRTGPAPRVLHNLVYVPGGGPRQTGDLHLPSGPGPHPVAVVMHGGGWRGRDRSDMTELADHLAREGVAAFNINYRLAPDHRFPAPVQDVHAALRFVARHAEDHALDRDRLFTAGYSAGAHLALLAAADPSPGHPPVRGVIAGGAPVDLTAYPNSPHVQALMGVSIEERPKAFRDASPIHQVREDHPPVFLYHGRLDAIVGYANATRMRDALREAGVPVALHTRPLLGHVLAYVWEGASIRRGVAFFRELGLLENREHPPNGVGKDE